MNSFEESLLVETRRQDVVEIAAAVHVLVHVDIVRTHRQLGFEFRIHQTWFNRLIG